MKWKIHINGNRQNLEDLERSLCDSRITITSEEDKFYLECKQLSDCKTIDEVRQLSPKILSVLNGAAKLALGGNSTITQSGILQENEDGTSHYCKFIEELIGVQDSFGLKVIDGNGNVVKEIYPADEVPAWTTLGLKNETVEKVFRLFGLKHDWVNLYRIYETIEHDIGSFDALVNKNWVTKSSLKLFKHTANSPGAIGDAARHGKESTTPPKKAMIFSEARSLIETLVHLWLPTK